MSSDPNDLGDDDWRLVALELTRLHHGCSPGRGSASGTETAGYIWTVENSEVNGYVAGSNTGVPESERAALAARLEADIAVLRHLAVTLEQLQTMVATPLMASPGNGS